MTDDLAWASAATLRDLVARRQVSPVELIEACLARIEALDPTLHAFTAVDADGALEAARRAEADARRGAELGPLHGVPVAVKDDQWATGMPATAGSLLFAAFRPSIDSAVVERLRRAGAIVVGKTNMPEFAAWPRSKSFVAGEAVNPWDPTRIPGASSGGSAAAVAAGIVPIATGSDGGGSTRIPSALCGTVGLYPTLGRVPAYGCFRCSAAGSAGPIGRTVADVALVQQVIAGPDPRVPSAMSSPAPDVVAGLEAGVAGRRVAWSPDFGRIPVDPRIVAAAGRALDGLGAAGAEVEEITDRIEHPWGDGTLMAELQAEVAAAAWDHSPTVADAPDVTDAEGWLLAGTVASEVLFALPEFRQLRDRNRHLLTPPAQPFGGLRTDASVPTTEELRASVDRVLAVHDVLCSPTMAVVAPVAPPGWASPYPDHYMGTNFTFIANATGYPAASVPCGLVDGLPVGFQIIGRAGDDATVLRVARAVEASIGAWPRPGAVAATPR